MNEHVKSPCVHKCKYDDFDLCMGCYRTKNEIVGWIDYTNTEKKSVIDKANRRRQPGMKYKIN